MTHTTRNRNIVNHTPANWQIDANCITTDTVQYWAAGTFVKVSKTEAIEMINTGNAFVISAQAIGALVNGTMQS